MCRRSDHPVCAVAALGASTPPLRGGESQSMKNTFFSALLVLLVMRAGLLAQQNRPAASALADVKPGSINCEDVAYPYATSSLPITLYGQEQRISYMDVPPLGQPNGHTVVLLHGNNFAGFYFGGPIDAIRKEGFRVIAPDQIGYGRSSKPIMPYNFSDMARNTRLILQSLKIDKAMVVGHSMGGMLAARFATQYPAMVERSEEHTSELQSPCHLVCRRLPQKTARPHARASL